MKIIWVWAPLQNLSLVPGPLDAMSAQEEEEFLRSGIEAKKERAKETSRYRGNQAVIIAPLKETT